MIWTSRIVLSPFPSIVIRSGKDTFKKWIEDVLGYHANILHTAKIHPAVHASLFTYIYNKHVLQAFLELWCHSVNTLHAAIGEISISLWDIRGLCGLPVCGEFYDEVVPSSKDLLGNETYKPFVPRSCKYLLLAYHHFPKDSDGVLISDWVGFWFKGSLRYVAPPLRSSRKRVHEPKLSRSPNGNVDATNLPYGKYHDKPFTIL
ncbi:hypothetical protein Sango_1721700 [Sesamum angolense]|uniref:Aminotransferase-like plant mobile domain-containing protein n=1 Tax=Sesamum angolense TaxID=2727404 RepID=A0AAE2BS18_9LAMI|nr:hypothetical protein Sango_1721700 [Sesamum angolense]